MAILRNSQTHVSYPSYNVQGWVDVGERGVLSFIGLALLALMTWGFGIAVVKAALIALAGLAQPAASHLMSQSNAEILWATGDGVAASLVVMLLQRIWRGLRRRNYWSEPMPARQSTPTLAAGIAAGLMALAFHAGALPTIVASGGHVDLGVGIPSLLASAHMFTLVGGAGGGGDLPGPDLVAGWGALLAILIVLLIAGALAGGIVGGGLGALGLGAVSGCAEGATSRVTHSETGSTAKNSRAAALGNAASGAASGAFTGAVSAALSIHLTAALAQTQNWATFIVFDILATITAAILLLLCRRSRDNPTGLPGNAFEAGKVVILLLQCALGVVVAGVILALGGGLLAGALFLLKWLFN